MDTSILHRELFAGFTLLHVLIAAFALFLVASVWRAVTRTRVGGGNHLVKKRCAACRWTGEVSQFNLKCPRCASKL